MEIVVPFEVIRKPEIELFKVGEDATTITLGWAPREDDDAGYRFSSELSDPKRPHTWNKERNTVRFFKGSAWYKVEALSVSATGEYRP